MPNFIWYNSTGETYHCWPYGTQKSNLLAVFHPASNQTNPDQWVVNLIGHEKFEVWEHYFPRLPDALEFAEKHTSELWGP